MEYPTNEPVCQGCGQPVDSDGDCLSCEKIGLDVAQDYAPDEEAED